MLEVRNPSVSVLYNENIYIVGVAGAHVGGPIRAGITLLTTNDKQ